jgi:hypothetical protein
MRRTLARAIVLASTSLALMPIVLDAILVSPPAVFLSSRTRTAQVYLINTGTSAEEVDLELKFGYPATDSLGQISVRLLDDPPPEEPSAAAWVRTFPRRVVVLPGRRQVVRVMAEPPANLPDGEYWTRMLITARGAQAPSAQAQDTAMRAGVSLVIRTITSVTYRQGEVRTGLRLDDWRVEPTRDSVVSWVAVTREGNAAWLGTTWIRLRDQAGRVVREWDTPSAVYHSVRRRFAFPADSLPPGAYVAELELTTRRSDLPAGVVLPAAPITRSLAVEVR